MHTNVPQNTGAKRVARLAPLPTVTGQKRKAQVLAAGSSPQESKKSKKMTLEKADLRAELMKPPSSSAPSLQTLASQLRAPTREDEASDDSSSTTEAKDKKGQRQAPR